MVSAAVAVADSILALTSLVPALPQTVTNGASVLGTLVAPLLSTTGVGGIITWGSDTVANTNPYTSGPVTGKPCITAVDLTTTKHFSRKRAYLQLQYRSRSDCPRWCE